MTLDEIMIPLKCFLKDDCECLKCTYNDIDKPCSELLYADILAFIKGKDEEIERLSTVSETFKRMTETQAETIGSLTRKLRALRREKE